ncbi:MAG: polysaccharide pyruvyl transferase family protein [Desulfobacterium sp.]|nr:polysaccharide pyruvyl transferase family protein [Desulfobacterium sp.]MBU3948094.1 polysaccharide pyruvyl transferase family protein [Pseudomonadota bacterium]MBU4011604.1 polysaccharide pyruvyl transferase family protein [Pseudomonadota bacterium]MBU4035561.1 polysaccharide pyruvyl transferase family protein [Pseudomonadota bacterium]
MYSEEGILKTVITNVWSDKNKGDYALVESIIRMAYDIDKNAQISAITFCSAQESFFSEDYYYERSEGISVFGSLHRTFYNREFPDPYSRLAHHVLAFVGFAIRVAVIGLMGKQAIHLMSKQYRESFGAMCDADIILVKGGGYITSGIGLVSDITYFYRVCSSMIVASILGKKFIICGASVWDVKSSMAKSVLRWIIDKSAMTIIREKKTEKYLLEFIGIKKDRIRILMDFAFYLKKHYEVPIKCPIDVNGYAIGLTVKAYFGKTVQMEYLQGITKIVEGLLKNGKTVYILPQTLGPAGNSCLPIMILLKKRFSDNERVVLVEKEYSLQEMFCLYSKMNYTIGTQFHSVIFSLLVNTPVIAIAYEKHKAHGIMEMMGMSDFAFDYDNLDVDGILDKIRYIETNGAQIRDMISRALNDRINRDYESLIELVRSIISR